MEYEFTAHAQKILQERKIPIEYIKDTILNPDLKFIDENFPELEHRLKEIKENENRVLRVIVNILTLPNRIVTVFYDRRMKGRL